MNISEILENTLGGARMSEEQAAILLDARGRDVWKIAEAADILREKRAGGDVTYVRNMNIHLTNICKNRCALCAFGRRPDEDGAYFLSDAEFRARCREALDKKVTEVCYLAGIHPDFNLDSYISIIRAFHEEIPGIHVHGCSPDEILYAAARSGVSTLEALRALKDAGLNSVQGTAAEILVDRVRRIICSKKLQSADWCRIIREAGAVGFKATSTIMYGSVETVSERARHLAIIREIQDDCGVFSELVPLAFLHKNTPLGTSGKVTHDAFGREDLLLIAVSRLFLDNIRNIQVPWSKIGQKMTQLCLAAGGNDVGGTMFVDSLSREAGAGEDADYFSPEEMSMMCEDIGRRLVQRDTLYNKVAGSD